MNKRNYYKLIDKFKKSLYLFPIILLTVIFLFGIYSSYISSNNEKKSNIQTNQIIENEDENILSGPDSEFSYKENTGNTGNKDPKDKLFSVDEKGQPLESDIIKKVEIANSYNIDENGNYTSKEEVALYIHTFKKLPNNFISKSTAISYGWDSKKGNLNDVLPGMSIGGNEYFNYDKILPVSEERKYYECDIDYKDGFRSGKRIVYSNDGLIFYTEDHYKTFEQLY